MGAECENYVLYFGRYSEEKGISNLVKAAKKLSNIPFVFAGKGELENEVNSADNIKNVGFKLDFYYDGKLITTSDKKSSGYIQDSIGKTLYFR